MAYSDGQIAAIIGAIAAIGVKGADWFQAKYGKQIDRDTTREGQLFTRITEMEKRFDAQERHCQERTDKLEAEVDTLRAENQTLRDAIYQLTHPKET